MESEIEFVDLSAARRLSGLSTSTIYRAVKANRFPKPVHLSVKSSRWIRSEIIAWRDERIAERGGLS